MSKVTDVISEVLNSSDVQCMPTHRRNLDFSDDYRYDPLERAVDEQFEDPPLNALRKSVLPDVDPQSASLFGYFLDGSRRTYRFADMILGGRYYPILAGQVGVAVSERLPGGTIKPVKQFCRSENIIAFPDRVGAEDIKSLEEQLNKKVRILKFQTVNYTYKKDRNPVDLGIAKIMARMHELEISMIHELSEANLLRPDKMLIVDGPLQFKDRKLNVGSFRNVIGVSKSFRPNFQVTTGKRKKTDVGTIVQRLEFGRRTTCFKTEFEGKTFGSWYLRIRDPKFMMEPLQGAIRIEALAIEAREKEFGFDSSRIDQISRNLLSERNVAPTGQDNRWATHLYPVYLTEQYIKNNMVNDKTFLGCL